MSGKVTMEQFCDRYEKWDERNTNETRMLAWMAEQLGLDFPEFQIDESEGEEVNERVVKCVMDEEEGFESDDEEGYVVPEHEDDEVDEWMDEEADDEEEEDCVERRDDRNLFIRMIWMMCEIARFG